MNDLLNKINSNGNYYSLARYALLNIVKNLPKNIKLEILMPEFICRDVLAPFNQLGFKIVYYKLSKDFQPILDQSDFDKIKLILIVNYFGFPASNEIIKLCKSNNVIVIEDNAHGFLSRNNNEWLGLRGDIGIFSFRKTLLFEDGAAYIVNNKKLKMNKNKVIISTIGFNPNVKIKRLINSIPYLGIYINLLLKKINSIKTNNSISLKDINIEYFIPHKEYPSKDIFKLKSLNIESEVTRRRKLYKQCDIIAKQNKIKPLFNNLSTGIAPMGYPFKIKSNSIKPLKQFALKNGLDIILWPELPKEIENKISQYFKDIMIINFLI